MSIMPEGDAPGFSAEWDECYAKSTHLSVWPWTDVVVYTQRYAKPREQFTHVLELGCGAGANIPFFVARGDHYHAIEGSPHIVGELHRSFPALAANILVGDFTQSIPFETLFDLVLDRGSVTCNDTRAIARCLALVHASLRSGGMMFGIDWLTSRHAYANRGVPLDSHTRTEIDTSMQHGVGKLHFSDRGHLMELLVDAGFEVRLLEHKSARMLIGGDGFVRDVFNFIAVKPEDA